MASKSKKKPEPDEESELDGEGSPPAPPSKFPFKMIIIAVGALAVLGGGGAGAYFLFAGGGGHEGKAAAAPVKPAVFLDVPEVLVNLSNTSGDRTQYLKVKVVLELADAALQAQIQSAMPRVMDAFQTYLRELRPMDLEGSAGLYRLKEELTRRINLAIAPSHVNAVLFKEIVVQ